MREKPFIKFVFWFEAGNKIWARAAFNTEAVGFWPGCTVIGIRGK